MKDLPFSQILDRARSLQTSYYPDLPDLNQRLIAGCMTNLAQAQSLKWKVPDHDVKMDRKRLMGLADAFHYIVSLLSLEGESDEIVRLLMARALMTKHLHETELDLEDLVRRSTVTKFAVVDVDGVLFPYPQELKRFTSCFPDLSPAEAKEKYRLSGVKASIPPIEGARDLLVYLQDSGWKIVILSARKVELYPEVYIDTLAFLEKYNLPYDLLLFKEEKQGGKVLPDILERTDIFIDDTLDQVKLAIAHNCPLSILISSEPHPAELNCHRCTSVEEARKLIDKLSEEGSILWRQQP